MRKLHLGILAAFSLVVPISAQPASELPLSVRFIDSATGYAVQPDEFRARGQEQGMGEHKLTRSGIHASGRASIPLARGRHHLSAVSENYKPMSGEFEMTEDNRYAVRFLLDPLTEPREIQADYIGALRRPDAMVLLGFVVDDESGQPLDGVQVRALPSGILAVTDERGFFQMHAELPGGRGQDHVAGGVVFERPGYETHERFNVEMWPEGDAIFRIRLNRGSGKQIVDDGRPVRTAPTNEEEASASPSGTAKEPQLKELSDVPGLYATAPSNSTVRVPRNIRVLLSDNVTIEYVTLTYYTRAVLGSEWIASWGNIAGGTNSLNAGAVAVRCYAIARINAPSSTYDICATTSCQVYNPANIHALSDTAVNYTANWVLIGASGTISSTEYSAENNSLGFPCGDGFTSPTGGCLYDPACAGEVRFGHGRGMCQWGTARWATGRKMAGRVSGDATPNGYPRRDWMWIVRHYYPALTLVKGAPLIIGDDIKAMSTVNVRACPGGTITNGVNCASIASKAAGSTGVIIDGPIQVTNDNGGYTWYQIQWNDASSTVGWSVENYLERLYSGPSAPSSLTATAISSNQINLTWTDTSGGVASWFKVERAMAGSGPWLQLTNMPSTLTSYSDRNLYPGSTWYYRVRAYSPATNSAYSNVASANTTNPAPVFSAATDRVVTEQTLLAFTNTATAPDFVKLITDFEPFMSETANGVVLFRDPRNSPSTVGFLDVTQNLAAVVDVFPTNSNPSGRVLRIRCNFTNSVNPWLRLTTAATATFPNPVIDFTRKLRFNIYADKPIRIAAGCRETATAGGAVIGSDGGTVGTSIEWAGVTNTAGTAPVPTRTIAASNWSTVTFDFPNEPIVSFSGGNGVLSTASGLGVLEHLAIVPAAGTGPYNIYLDNFAVVVGKTLTYSLTATAPTNASINPVTGVFSWTPTESQGPATNLVSVVVTDNSIPPLKATNTFSVVVLESNSPPVLNAVADRSVHAGVTVSITNQATDPDVPVNTVGFSLDTNAPAGSAIDPVSGIFTWTPSSELVGSTNAVTVFATDNGVPPLNDAVSFNVLVFPNPAFEPPAFSGNMMTITWSAINGTRYRVQFKNDLSDVNWTDIAPDVTATGVTASLTVATDLPQRFFRILVVE